MAADGAVLTIDLDAIVANYAALQSKLGDAELGAVVKADAYGLGIAHVAPALWQAGCKSFFIATPREGVVLRQLLPDADIHVLDGLLPGWEEIALAHGLVPVLNTLDEIGRWSRLCRDQNDKLRADIQVDTGMCRLGLTPEDVASLATDDGTLGTVAIDCLISHLACSDDAANPKNEEQRAAFADIAARLLHRRASLAASSGIFLGPGFHFDLARAGVALFGVNPTPGKPNPMSQVIRLQGRILQVRSVDAPQTVGYGATHRVDHKCRLATVAIGYADGYMRSLGNSGVAYIDGHKAPVVGRVSMDLTTLDVTDVPENLAQPGALADMIGSDNPIDDVAEKAGTIGYELLTRLGHRFQRTYVGGGAA